MTLNSAFEEFVRFLFVCFLVSILTLALGLQSRFFPLPEGPSSLLRLERRHGALGSLRTEAYCSGGGYLSEVGNPMDRTARSDLGGRRRVREEFDGPAVVVGFGRSAGLILIVPLCQSGVTESWKR